MSTVEQKRGALHEDFGRHQNVEGSSHRSFGIVFAVVFGIIGIFPLLAGGEARWWALGASGLILLLALLTPRVLAPANRLWLRFGLMLGRITTPVVLGFVFFAVVTPTALLMRAFGKDPLRLRREDGRASWWTAPEADGRKGESMRRQF